MQESRSKVEVGVQRIEDFPAKLTPATRIINGMSKFKSLAETHPLKNQWLRPTSRGSCMVLEASFFTWDVVPHPFYQTNYEYRYHSILIDNASTFFYDFQ